MKMPGWGRRLKVAASWALDVLLPAELAQLKLDDSEKLSKEHFEPGQEVFVQGDLGDRVYIIEKGMVRYQGSMGAFLADAKVREAYLAI